MPRLPRRKAIGKDGVTCARPMPLSPEEFERRAQRREGILQTVKLSVNYEEVEARPDGRPMTPNPRQAEVSKRSFDKLVMQWRNDMKALEGGAGGHDESSCGRLRWVTNRAITCPPPRSWEPMYVDLPADLFPSALPSELKFWKHPANFAKAVKEPIKIRRGRSSSPTPGGANTICSEEVLHRRLTHRQNGVFAVKRSDDYIFLFGYPRPKSPDPINYTRSKRKWEGAMQQWRFDMRALTQVYDLHERPDAGVRPPPDLHLNGVVLQ